MLKCCQKAKHYDTNLHISDVRMTVLTVGNGRYVTMWLHDQLSLMGSCLFHILYSDLKTKLQAWIEIFYR